ncbi:MAG: hypothetical protein QXV17_12340 [Candidatus Micrarchaeaceae archaeon]
MMIKKTTQGMSSFSTLPHTSQIRNLHPFTQQPIKTIQQRVISHPLLTQPTKQAMYPEHPIGMPSMSFYREKRNDEISITKQPTSQPTLKVVSSMLNPFTKGSGGLGGLGGLGPVGGNTTPTWTPENTLPFNWKGYSTPTLPPTEKTTETPIPKWLPWKWQGIGIVKPPIEKTTIPTWHPIHGVPTLPPNQGKQKSTTTQPTQPTQPQENPNATYGVLGSIVLMLIPFIL